MFDNENNLHLRSTSPNQQIPETIFELTSRLENIDDSEGDAADEYLTEQPNKVTEPEDSKPYDSQICTEVYVWGNDEFG